MRAFFSALLGFALSMQPPVLYALWDYLSGPTRWQHAPGPGLLFELLFIYYVVGIYAVLIGLPAFLVALVQGWLNLWTCIAIGMAIAACICFISFHGSISWTTALERFETVGPMGALGGVIFWTTWNYLMRKPRGNLG